jgi:hypothetical protein
MPATSSPSRASTAPANPPFAAPSASGLRRAASTTLSAASRPTGPTGAAFVEFAIEGTRRHLARGGIAPVRPGSTATRRRPHPASAPRGPRRCPRPILLLNRRLSGRPRRRSARHPRIASRLRSPARPPCRPATLDIATALHRIRHARGSAPDAFEGENYLTRVAALFDAIEHPNLLRLDAAAPPADLVATIGTRIERDLNPSPSQPPRTPL